MNDEYFYWREALDGRFGPVHDGEAQCGFWRTKRGEPVAIWRDNLGLLWAREAARTVDPGDIWSWCCTGPVTYEAYKSKIDGQPWPDVDENIVTAPPAMGHNAPVDDFEVLSDQIASALAGVGKYAKIEDDETSAKAQSLRARLNELSGQADKKRAAEKKPHLEAGNAVDAKWQPKVKEAKAGADKIADAMSAWETAKAREEDRRRAETLAADRKAEREAQAAIEAGKPAPPPLAPAEPIAAPAPVSTIKGGYGRAATVKAVKTVTAITDWPALYAFLKDHAELKDLMTKLAQRAVNAGLEPPGCTIEEQRKVA